MHTAQSSSVTLLPPPQCNTHAVATLEGRSELLQTLFIVLGVIACRHQGALLAGTFCVGKTAQLVKANHNITQPSEPRRALHYR